jgi:hypothetical protein
VSAVIPTIRGTRVHNLSIFNCYVQVVFEGVSSWNSDIDCNVIRKLLHCVFNIWWEPKTSHDPTKHTGLPPTRFAAQGFGIPSDTDNSYLQQAGPNRRWQLPAAGSEGQTSRQQSAQDGMQSAQLTVAQLGYCLAPSLLHGLRWWCDSVVRLETMPVCVSKQFWWSWVHCQMLLLFVTWYPDLYPPPSLPQMDF